MHYSNCKILKFMLKCKFVCAASERKRKKRQMRVNVTGNSPQETIIVDSYQWVVKLRFLFLLSTLSFPLRKMNNSIVNNKSYFFSPFRPRPPRLSLTYNTKYFSHAKRKHSSVSASASLHTEIVGREKAEWK